MTANTKLRKIVVGLSLVVGLTTLAGGVASAYEEDDCDDDSAACVLDNGSPGLGAPHRFQP